mmetsp:Transcript_66859/g.160045  ORF Transcript_66859/g.160045 Transcript_66859/m.160045 type:complete len:495 (+) Transcript_66859:83-1567(+)
MAYHHHQSRQDECSASGIAQKEWIDFSPVLRCYEQVWADAGRRLPQNLAEFASVAKVDVTGLEQMFHLYPETKETFFSQTLPFIVEAARGLKMQLEDLRFGTSLPKLARGMCADVKLPREVVLSLLAHMFLCTTDHLKQEKDMPDVSFSKLLSKKYPSEVAKLRMVVEYFAAVRVKTPKYLRGELRIYRQVRDGLRVGDRKAEWQSSLKPLLPLEVEKNGIGFEDTDRGDRCVHADFANQFLGGGILRGGSVQEEIRFAICPELIAALLVCPRMLDNEAIFIVGAEQFSKYSGYSYGLKYAGPHAKSNVPRDADGTPLISITAMDALDFRGHSNALHVQMQPQYVMRELEKAAAAFSPADQRQEEVWPVIATGNWGCGAFRGFAPLKAVLQWLAASQGGRRMRYFPFDEPIRNELMHLSASLTGKAVTVGQLFEAVTALAPMAASNEPGKLKENFWTELESKVMAEVATSSTPCKPNPPARRQHHRGCFGACML